MFLNFALMGYIPCQRIDISSICSCYNITKRLCKTETLFSHEHLTKNDAICIRCAKSMAKIGARPRSKLSMLFSGQNEPQRTIDHYGLTKPDRLGQIGASRVVSQCYKWVRV